QSTDLEARGQRRLGITRQSIARIALKEFFDSFLSGPVALLKEVAIADLVVLLGIARCRKGVLRAETRRDILAQDLADRITGATVRALADDRRPEAEIDLWIDSH